MRILVLSEFWYPHGSGAEVASRLYARAWASAGADVTILTNQHPGETSHEKLEGYTVLRAPLFNANRRLPSYQIQLYSLRLQSKLENLIVSHDIIYIPGKLYWAAVLARKHGKKVVCHMHDYGIVCPLDTLYNTTSMGVCSGCGLLKGARCINLNDLQREVSVPERAAHITGALGAWRNYASTIANYVDCFIFVSKSQKELFAQVAPSIAIKGRIVYNPLPDVYEMGIEELGFVYLGGGYRFKGYNTILSALSIYRPPYPFYATKCSDSEGRILSALGVRAYPKVSPQELAGILRKAHCVVFPSVWEEPLPYTFVEAMLAGKMLIATRIGSVIELAESADGVIKIATDSPQDLAQALERASSLSLSQARELGRQNRVAITDFYKHVSPPEQLLSVFHSLCEK